MLLHYIFCQNLLGHCRIENFEITGRYEMHVFNQQGGNIEKCAQCNKTVYAMEKMEVAGRLMHKTCFRCCKCNSPLKYVLLSAKEHPTGQGTPSYTSENSRRQSHRIVVPVYNMRKIVPIFTFYKFWVAMCVLYSTCFNSYRVLCIEISSCRMSIVYH